MPKLGNVTISNTVTPGLAAWSAEAQRALTSEMVRATNDFQNKARRRLVWRNAPGAPGGRATGQLSRSIQTAVDSTPHRIEGQIGVGVHYGKYVEGWNSMGEHKPIRKHYVPFKVAPDLQKWLLRHGVEGAENAKGWMVGGPDFPSPFMQPTLEEEQPRYAARFAAALQRTMHG